MASNPDEETHRRDYRPGYGPKHQIPTVKQYRDFKQEQKENLEGDSDVEADETAGHRGDGMGRFFSKTASYEEKQSSESPASQGQQQPQGNDASNDDGDMIQKYDKEDTTESAGADAKERRKNMKHRKAGTVERQVTDPVTHLPVTIRDFTNADLEAAGAQHEDESLDVGQDYELSAHQKQVMRRTGTEEFEKSIKYDRAQHQGMLNTFPPPSYQMVREDLAEVYRKAMLAGLGALVVLLSFWALAHLVLPIQHMPDVQSTERKSRGWNYRPLVLSFVSIAVLGSAAGVVYLLQGWVAQKASEAWEDALWEAQRMAKREYISAPEPEPTIWLNKLLSSVWPLINPDLFSSLVDTLEDVMQASLPKMVRMVSVDDLGQGSEPIRILGIKWLPRGAAAKSVSSEGQIVSNEAQTEPKRPGQNNQSEQQKNAGGDVSEDANNRNAAVESKQDNEENEQDASGLEAEDGEFVNFEVAFAYRASKTTREPKDRQRNAHLYMAFYLPGQIKFPVWVEVRGLVGTMRVRMQLTPDPPFIALTTITLLGQPKVDISCTPLIKKGPNIMDVPLISNFVQSAVDAAMNEYVAPKSLTLDLKAMLAGDDFKHDTVARGVLVVRIHRAFDFKASDLGIPLVSEGSSDPYVSVGWAKFGKPQFSTRVLVDNMEPYWEEQTTLTIGPEELDAEESIRLQLWDSDRGTADDDLGRIEVSLKELMNNKESNGKMWTRKDTFEAMKAGETMPGRLQWSVGYFTKVRLMDSQVAYKHPEHNITTVEQLRDHSFRESSKKLREVKRDEAQEADQLKEEDFQTTCTELITTSPPSSTYPSGILSLQIHQVVGLELEKMSRTRAADGGDPEEGTTDEDGDEVPDSYCTITVNHQKIFKTRTKPKNSKPFFNAGTERFIRDWRTTTIMISVRDNRVHEDHPLLGIVCIQLGDILQARGASRLVDFFPLAGGIGYGRMRVSIVFRSVQMQPLPQQLGWDWGTVEVAPKATAPSKELPHELHGCRIKVRTPLGKGTLWHSRSASNNDDHHDSLVWTARKSRPIRLPVRKRYAAPVIFEFRSSRMLLPDQSPAFAILWLQNIPDEEETTLELPVYRGDVKRAEANVLPEDQNGEKVGTVHVQITFLRGLGLWHGKIAKKSPDVSNVMECLVVARDHNLFGENAHLVGDSEWLASRGKYNSLDDAEDVGNSGSDSGSDSDGETIQTSKTDGSGSQAANSKANNGHADAGKSPGGIIAKVKDYKANQDQLHRRQRGMMQWKGPRTVKWLKGKAEHAGDKVKGMFEHSDRQSGIETEV